VGGVDRAHLGWAPFDGVGRSVRNCLNFTERGFGVRAALGVSDRGHTAASQLQPGDVDWEGIFGREGPRWFHTGGSFSALSKSTADVAREAMEAARRHGTVVSYDLNYRASLWKGAGGPERAAFVNRTRVEHTTSTRSVSAAPRRIRSLIAAVRIMPSLSAMPPHAKGDPCRSR
jgi:2-dehydro-3-deoxygluconokinase